MQVFDLHADDQEIEEDYVQNGQINGYNVQNGSENQFILDYSLHQRPTDTHAKNVVLQINEEQRFLYARGIEILLPIHGSLKRWIISVCISPQKYVQKLRMERAKSLLLQLNLTVTEVALSVGYMDAYLQISAPLPR
ncbi:MAG: hypothetical protein A2189_09000 [Paenibacillus sp. RIFOXYA1_FULL_44_5]|nr:MAG: hypothetical protein A2189_09000 [Paenibacillus sp. RIFOXYA1_FULL_44_5]